MNQLIVEK